MRSKDFEIDQSFDGVKDTTPDGVLYIVTGAGGAGAYDPDQTDKPSWQVYTAKFVSDVYSFTTVDGSTLTMRQISATADELDRIVLTKRSRLIGQEGLARTSHSASPAAVTVCRRDRRPRDRRRPVHRSSAGATPVCRHEARPTG